MLREVKNGGWFRVGLLWKRYVFQTGQLQGRRVKRVDMVALNAEQQVSAVLVMRDDAKRRTYWWCLDRFYWEDDELAASDVYALVYERQMRAKRQLERAHATVAAAEIPANRRERIPKEVRLAVWQRDGGRCVECAATFELQFDHVIPVAMGGATTLENLQVLCGDCNRAKGATLG